MSTVPSRLAGRTIIVGVSGGISAYKSGELVRRLIKLGASVRVVMTASATRLVTPLTLRTLSENPVICDLFDPENAEAIEHVALGGRTDLLVIAPATANIMAKMAAGLADDALSTTALACRCPVLLAPAMHTAMWEHPATRASLATLAQRGVHFVGPEYGPLASGDVGVGRMADVSEIVEAALKLVSPQARDLEGRVMVVTAGPTRERIDPVRFISNRSSGKMGYAVAAVAARRGARVRLVSGPTSLPAPRGVEVTRVESAQEMLKAVLAALPEADALISAAAVCDVVPAEPQAAKTPKASLSAALPVKPAPDVLAAAAAARTGLFLVGFAAETGAVEENARAKLEAKGLDVVVANDVSRADIGFDSDYNEVIVLCRTGERLKWPRLSKTEVAERLLDLITARLPSR